MKSEKLARLAKLPPTWIEFIQKTHAPKPQNALREFPEPDSHALAEATRYLSQDAEPAIAGSAGRSQLFHVAATATERWRLPVHVAFELVAEHFNPRCAPPWNFHDEKELHDFEDTIRNANRKAQNIKSAPTEVFTPIGADSMHSNPSTESRSRSSLLFLENSMHPELKTLPLIDGLLSQDSTAVLYGPSNVGKTFVALDLGYSVARGIPWLGKHEAIQGSVLYVALESGYEEIAHRLEAYRVKWGLTTPVPFYLCTTPLDLSDSTASGWKALLPEIRNLPHPPKLIVIDTLARALAGKDENSSKDMGGFIKAIDKLRAETSACVLVIHHTGKDEERGARGSSALKAAMDTELFISSAKTIVPTKQRAMTKQGVAIQYDLEVVKIGVNPRGKDVCSCVLVERRAGVSEAFLPSDSVAQAREEGATYRGRFLQALEDASAEQVGDDPMAGGEIRSVAEERVWEIIQTTWYGDKSGDFWRPTKAKIRKIALSSGYRFEKGRIYRRLK